jgi:uncharacterized membrane protein
LAYDVPETAQHELQLPIVKTFLLKYWDRLRSSFWFIPSLMAGGAIGLSFVTVALDEGVTDRWLQSHGWAYTGGAEGASSVLSTVAASMIGIAGVVFSMTLVALTLASSQLGPRLLRNFMRDTANQVVLGAFVATFVYCLLVLRTIRRADEIAFVPHLSVTVGVLLAIVSLGVLIYFIHHVSVSIHADEVVARVGAELIEGIERLFPDRVAGAQLPLIDSTSASLPAVFDRESCAIESRTDGYVQIVDVDALNRLAAEAGLLVRLEQRPGLYVVKGRPLMRAWPRDRVTDEVASRASAAFVTGNQRTSAQDVEFAIHQLVEIAVRALSPGINDPFTANTCLDRLGSALCLLATRRMTTPNRIDDDGQLRVIVIPTTFQQLVDAAFDQIRQYARSSVGVTIHLLDTITVIAGSARGARDRGALKRQADLIVAAARVELRESGDLRTVEDRYHAACSALAGALQ